MSPLAPKPPAPRPLAYRVRAASGSVTTPGSRIVNIDPSPWALVTVADNGPGIASEDRERVIDRFIRLDNARTRPGAGLGLAMVNAVAQLHGGALELSGGDAPDVVGLVATLRLPR